MKSIVAGAQSHGRQIVNAPMLPSLIGARVARKEDYRFLTGAGQYTDDVSAARTRRTPRSCARRTRMR